MDKASTPISEAAVQDDSSSRRGWAFSGIKSKFQERKANKEEEQANKVYMTFQDMAKSKKRFTLQDYFEMTTDSLEKEMTGWKSHIPGVKSSDAFKDVERTMAILRAFTKEEREDPDNIKRKQKLRVAGETGHSNEAINSDIGVYDQMSVLHKWIRFQMREGNELPGSWEAARQAFENNPKGVKMSRRMAQKQRGRHRRRLALSAQQGAVDMPGEGLRSSTMAVRGRPTEALYFTRDVRTAKAFYWADEKGREWPLSCRRAQGI